MPAPWTAEFEVSQELARTLIAQQFPDLEPVHVAHLGTGWDNTAFLVNERWVFRFPRRQLAVGLLQQETKLLPHLAPQLMLPVPVPTNVGEPSSQFPWPFAGYPLLAGETACRAGLNAAQRMAAAGPIATFLKSLHGLPAQAARANGAGPDTLDRMDFTKRGPETRQRLEEMQQFGYENLSAAQSLLDDFIATPAGERPAPVLVHGDLYARHILVDGAGRPCGVIDWGDVHVGDRSLDLSIAYSFLPPDAREAFFAAYGPIDEETKRLARRRALFSAVAILRYGHDVGDEALVREGQIALGYVLDQKGD